MSSPAIPARAMLVVAHPDDPEFMAGGAVGLWTDAGAQVAYVIVSDGSKGSDDRSLAPRQLSEIRAEEQQRAGAILGVAEIVFLGLPDGELCADLSTRIAIARQIRKWRPDTVVTHDPARIYYDDYINHPDHRAVGEATLAAVFPTARDHLSAPSLLGDLEPHIVRTILLGGAVAPDHWIDIGPVLDRKIESLSAHASQIADPAELATRVRQRASELADGHGMHYAEAFKRIVMRR